MSKTIKNGLFVVMKGDSILSIMVILSIILAPMLVYAQKSGPPQIFIEREIQDLDTISSFQNPFHRQLSKVFKANTVLTAKADSVVLSALFKKKEPPTPRQLRKRGIILTILGPIEALLGLFLIGSGSGAAGVVALISGIGFTAIGITWWVIGNRKMKTEGDGGSEETPDSSSLDTDFDDLSGMSLDLNLAPLRYGGF